MLSAGPLETGTVHTLESNAPVLEIVLRIKDPRTGEPRSLPAGVSIGLLADGEKTPFVGTTNAEGRATVSGSDQIRNVSLFVDFGGAGFLDLDGNALLAKRVENDARGLVALPVFWRSDEATSMFDDLDGRCQHGTLEKLVDGGQGTPAAPWEIRIDHEWRHIDAVFEYYDVLGETVARLPFGGFVEAFRGDSEAADDLVGASTVLMESGIASIPLFRPCPPSLLRLRLTTAPGSYLRLDEADPRKKMVRLSPDEVAVRPVAERRRLYALPRRWLARGQICTLGPWGSDQAFEAAAEAAMAEEGPALHFDLDDVVLVRESGLPLRFTWERRIALFDGRFEVIDPDPDARYFSRVKTTTNLLRAREHFRAHIGGGRPPLRAIQRGRSFFEVGDVRTSRGKIIGARAAVGNAHPNRRLPKAGIPGTFRGRADVHYFRDVETRQVPLEGERAVDVAVIFVSTRLRPMNASAKNHLGRVRARLAEAAEIWGCTEPDGRRIWICSRSAPRDVRLVFHVVALEQGRPNVDVFVWDPRSDKPKRAYVGLAMHLDLQYDVGPGKRMVAHELGHVMGLVDEYPEKISEQRPVPRFAQKDRPLQLAHDEASVMHQPGAPRLRHYWAFSRWLVSLSGTAIEDDDYELYCPGAKRSHRWAWHEPPFPAELLKEPARLEPGSNGRLHLELATLGDDIDPLPDVLGCDAVLHVASRVHVAFRKNADGVGFSAGEKTEYFKRLFAEARAVEQSSRPRDLFTAELDPEKPASSTARDRARRVFIHFLPRFSTHNPGAADLRLVVRKPSADGASNGVELKRRRIVVTDRFGGTALRAHIVGSSGRQQPFLDVNATTIQGTLGFEVMGATAELLSAKSRSPGDGRFVGIADDGKSSLIPIPRDVIAKNIAEAVNDPGNATHALVAADAVGHRVLFEPRQEGLPIEITRPSVDTVVGLEWEATLAAQHLHFMAAWIGQALSATYTIVKHVV